MNFHCALTTSWSGIIGVGVGVEPPSIPACEWNFGIGVTEFVIMGLLIEVGADLGVSIPAAGMLISGYALGVVIGAPLMTVLTARWPRKTTLIMLMLVFTAGNLACALAPGY